MMSRLQSLTKIALSVLIVSVCFQFGCRPQQPLYLGETGRWHQQYIDKTTRIEIPHVEVPSLPEVCHTIAPLTLHNPDPNAMWDLTLEEAVQMALKNSQVIRTLTGVSFSQGGVGGVPSALLQSAGNVRTVYDPALMESDPRYGQEAALAAFDAQFNAGAQWDRNSNPNPNTQDARNAGTFYAGISKYTAPGTQFYINNRSRIDDGGDPNRYTTSLSGGFVHPLLRGSGIAFNRIAGPGGAPGLYGGVAIARINTDMSLNDFEMATRVLVADVEKAYWNLYYAYHRLDSLKTGLASAYQTWHQTMVLHREGAARGTAQNLAQSEQNYFEFRRQTELAQNNLFRADRAMRYIMGLSAADGRLIRPVDEPITAPIALDWHSVLCEALFRSPELRKQKWAVKQRELELTASRSFMLPRLDFEGGYGVSGVSDRGLIGRGGAYSALGDSYTMGGGGHNGWLGVTLSAPLGFRQEIAGVRHAELSLAKARKILQEQELELTHQLNDSFGEISLAYQQMQTTLASYQAATNEVRATTTSYDNGATTLDQVLQAQRRRSEAETSYHHSVIDYNLAIMTLHYRKGSLLEYNNVCLAEGEWPGKAYFDAKRRARERDAGRTLNYGLTLPGVVSRGTYQQHQHGYNSMTYEVLPARETLPIEVETPRGRDHYITPPVPPTSNRMIETDTTRVMPAPVLPSPGGNSPVSFTTPQVATPELTPSRNMRYVR